MHSLSLENGNNNPQLHVNADLKNLLVQLTHTLKAQQDEIESLKRSQIASQNQIKSQIDTTLKQFLHTQQKLSLNGGGNNSQSIMNSTNGGADLSFSSEDLQTKLALTLQQTLTTTIMPKMEKTIKDEIHKTVQTQYVQRLLDPVREQISREMAEKMKSVESVLKDSVNKLFKSKSTLDSISQSVTGSMQAVIVNSFRDTFQKMIIPTFEKTCQNMYQQVSCAFMNFRALDDTYIAFFLLLFQGQQYI
jgi:hypothetical protein